MNLSIKHYIGYFWENFVLNFKRFTEFKSNLSATIIHSFMFFLTTMIFGYVSMDIIFSSIGWTFRDFLVFSFFINILVDLAGFFWYGSYKNLVVKITTGEFNNYLTKPGNTFFLYSLGPGYNPIILIISDIFYYGLIFSFIPEIYFFNVFIGFLIVIFLGIILGLFVQSLISFSWILLELGNVLTLSIYSETIQGAASLYPFQFFRDNSIFSKILLFLPIAYISIMVVPVVSNLDFSYLLESLKYLMLITLMSIFIIYINWKIGLKKYEAYG